MLQKTRVKQSMTNMLAVVIIEDKSLKAFQEVIQERILVIYRIIAKSVVVDNKTVISETDHHIINNQTSNINSRK